MEFLVLWVIASIAVGYAAGQRGRGAVGWFFLSLLLSPILGVLILLACGTRAAASEQKASPDYGPVILILGFGLLIAAGATWTSSVRFAAAETVLAIAALVGGYVLTGRKTAS